MSYNREPPNNGLVSFAAFAIGLIMSMIFFADQLSQGASYRSYLKRGDCAVVATKAGGWFTPSQTAFQCNGVTYWVNKP